MRCTGMSTLAKAGVTSWAMRLQSSRGLFRRGPGAVAEAAGFMSVRGAPARAEDGKLTEPA